MSIVRIAIVPDENQSGGRTHYEFHKGFISAVKDNGARPNLVFYDDDPKKIVEQSDGIIMSGGYAKFPDDFFADGHTAYHPPSDRVAFEIELVELALEADVPIFAVCHGYHILAGVLDCKLRSDVPEAIHSGVDHLVDIEPNTQLYKDVGHGTIKVNSRHHEAIAEISDKVIISARAPDGCIEAIEVIGKDAMGVQWHAEDLWGKGDIPSQQIFTSFIQRCDSSRGESNNG